MDLSRVISLARLNGGNEEQKVTDVLDGMPGFALYLPGFLEST
jgi:hypothetical protein